MPKRMQVLCNVRETLVEDSDHICYKTFIDSLRTVLPDASMFLPGKTTC